jgi:hypothetical protein
VTVTVTNALGNRHREAHVETFGEGLHDRANRLEERNARLSWHSQ